MMSNLAKIEEASSECAANDATQSIMNLSLSDFCSNFKSSGTDGNEYFSSPSKSSSHEYSPLESTNFQTPLANIHLVRDLNNNLMDESALEPEKHVTKLFVGNLPTSTTLPELLNVFKKYGPVNEALSVVKDHNYAFIHFYNRKDAEIALKEVNDSLFKDRYIRVQFSTSQNFTNTKNKGLEKRRSITSLGNGFNHQNKFLPSTQSIPYSHSSPMLSNNLYSNAHKSYRPIVSNRIPTSQSALFDRNLLSPLASLNTQSNLLIEASKLQSMRLNSYNQFHQEFQQKQQIIQALYLKQQQQFLHQQIHQQLQQFQSSQNERSIVNSSIPKSNTISSFNFASGTFSNQNLNLNDNNVNKTNFNN